MCSSVTSHPIFPGTEPLIARTVEERRNTVPLPRTLDNKKILIKTLLASNLLSIYNRICQWCETENQAFLSLIFLAISPEQ